MNLSSVIKTRTYDEKLNSYVLKFEIIIDS